MMAIIVDEDWPRCLRDLHKVTVCSRYSRVCSDVR